MASTAHVELANALLGSVGLSASLTLTHGFSYTHSFSESWTLPVPSHNCWDNFGRIRWVEKRVTGHTTMAKVIQDWGCTIGDTTHHIRTRCGLHTVTGSASNDHLVMFDYTHRPPTCGGPDPIDPDHDGWTDEPCGSCTVAGIVGCPPISGEKCCGIIGGS